DHAEARARDAEAHDAALAELRRELASRGAQHHTELDALHGELEELAAQHEHAKGQLVEVHRRDVDERAEAHAAELAQAEEEHHKMIADLQRAAVEARAGAERVAAQQRGELEQRLEAAARDASDHRTALLGAKRALDEAAARHKAEREAAERASTKAL